MTTKKGTRKQRKEATAQRLQPPSSPAGGRQPRLIFPPAAGTNEGFTNAAASQFVNDPASCVRELIQNSLDAALVEQREKTAIVNFTIGSCRLEDLPGIGDYRAAYNAARENVNNNQSKNASNRIGKLLSEQEVAVLYVADNGIGFSEAKLNAMLGDGISDKKNENASGSFGNGHLTTFALSDLQYIFYGGVLEGGATLYTGHATLASHIGKHAGKKSALSKNGYFVKRIRQDQLKERFDFPDGDAPPPLLADEMEKIKRDWGHGALVAVTAFNYFSEPRDTNADIILRETALNFFIAIQQEKLEVRVQTDGAVKTLSAALLKQLIEKEKDRKRGKHGFPSGNRIWNAYNTRIRGEKHTLRTTHGDIILYLRPNTDAQKIALCRNGMWITDNLPRLQPSHFSNKVNFDAVLLVDAETSGAAHTLLKTAESPLHNSIEPARRVSDSSERKKLNDMLVEIRDQIKELLEDKKTAQFTVNRILPVEVNQSQDGDKVNTNADSQPLAPMPAVIKTPVAEKGKGRGKAAKAARHVAARMSCRRLADNKLMLTILADETCENAEIRLAVDSGQDMTCTEMANDGIPLTGIRCNDIDSAAIKPLTDDAGNIYAAQLGALQTSEQGKAYQLHIDYQPPPDLHANYAIAVNLLHRAAQRQTKQQAAKRAESNRADNNQQQ